MYYPIYLSCCRDLLVFFALTHSMSVVIWIESNALWVIIPPNARCTYFPCHWSLHPAASIILYDCPRLIAIRPASFVARHARLSQVAVRCSVSHRNYYKLDTCDVALRSAACPVRRAPRLVISSCCLVLHESPNYHSLGTSCVALRSVVYDRARACLSSRAIW